MAIEAETIFLLILIIAAFIVAFAVLKMIIETVVVGAVSALFYVTLTYVTELNFSAQTMLTYTFLGVTLYMGYSVMASLMELTSGTAKTGKKILKSGSEIIATIFTYFRNQIDLEHLEITDRIRNLAPSEVENKGNDEEDDSQVKEVILDENK